MSDRSQSSLSSSSTSAPAYNPQVDTYVAKDGKLAEIAHRSDVSDDDAVMTESIDPDPKKMRSMHVDEAEGTMKLRN